MKSLRRFVSTYWGDILAGAVGWMIGSLLFLFGIKPLHVGPAFAITAGVVLLLAMTLFSALRSDYWRKQAEDLTDCVTGGVEAINEERAEQIGKHGWSEEHDDKHEEHELTRAARAYIAAAEWVSEGRRFDQFQSNCVWRFEIEAFKPSPDPRANLAKAGALIAAAYDRLDRSTQCENCDRWTPNIVATLDDVFVCEKTCAPGLRAESASLAGPHGGAK